MAPFAFPEPIVTERLVLTAAGVDVMDAWLERDVERLDRLLDARFPEDGEVPPKFDRDLAEIRDRARDDPGEVGVSWVVLSKTSREPIGMVDLAPVEDGVWRVGFAVYPEMQSRGYATEAVRTAVAWALAQPGVDTVRATIPAWNVSSIRVAEKVGMSPSGTGVDPEAGEILVYERGDAPPDQPPPV